MSVDVVTLRGGTPVPLAAIQLALDLEERGITMRLDDGTLVVRPRSLLTEDDIARIREHRDALKTFVAYEAPPL